MTPMPDSERKELARLWLAGWKLPRIARRLGYHPHTVQRWRERLGLPPRRVYDHTRRRVARLHAKGLPVRTIADRLGVRPQTVRAHLKRAGLTPHPDRDAQRRRAVRFKREHGHSLGEFAHERMLADSILSGWPPVYPGGRRHLEALERLGPATVADAAAAVGHAVPGVRTMLWRLRRAGHVVAERRPCGLTRELVYDLAPAVRERRRMARMYRNGEVPE